MTNEVSVFHRVMGQVGYDIKKNGPVILTGMACAGFISTLVMAVSATPKALRIINAQPVEPTTLECIKLVWLEYFPTALMGTATLACIIAANSISTRRTAAAAGLYTMTRNTLEEYKRHVIENLGEKKHEMIEEKIAQSNLDRNPVSANTVIITGGGDTLCFDRLSGRYFKSNIEKLRRAENKMNREIFSEMWISLNEFYLEIGLPAIDLGHDIGWSTDDLIELGFNSKLTDTGEPCLVMNFDVDPITYYKGA